VRNQYEWILYVHQYQSRWNIMSYENTKRVRRMNPNPNYPNWLIQIIYFASFNFLQIHDTNDLSNKLLHIFLHLINIILRILELILVRSISVLRDKLLLLTRYTYRKIVTLDLLFQNLDFCAPTLEFWHSSCHHTFPVLDDFHVYDQHYFRKIKASYWSDRF